MSTRVRRRRVGPIVSTLLAACVIAGVGCKRRDTLPPVVFAPLDDASDGSAVADAPAWPTPARAVLENHALVYWQHEAGMPGFHVRLLLPTIDMEGEPLAAATVLLAARTFEVRLAGALKRRGVAVNVAFAPGRFEVVLSGPKSALPRSMSLLATALGTAPSDRNVARGQGRAVKEYRLPRFADVAAVDVVARSLGRSPSTELAGRAELLAGEPRVAWRELTDPRRCVLVVHTGVPADEGAALLAAMASKWSAPWGGDDATPRAVDRLRRAWPEPATSRAQLRGTAQASLFVVTPDVDVSRGQPTLVLGRVIPTPTAPERAMARLAQRITQEAVDARLEFAGSFAVFLVRVPLLQSDVVKSVERPLRDLTKLAETEQTRGRLQQAARLWLGARLVARSLDGEDWTALWSESLDLVLDDAEITRALAHEAQGMLAITPAALSEWMQRWLHPEKGEGGWRWSIAGLEQEQLDKLGEFTKFDTSAWTR